MSIGGNVGHFATVLLLFAALSFDTPGRVALLAGSIGSAVFASRVEFPVIRKAMEGAAPLEALSGITSDSLKQSGMWGAAAALVTLLVV